MKEWTLSREEAGKREIDRPVLKDNDRASKSRVDDSVCSNGRSEKEKKRRGYDHRRERKTETASSFCGSSSKRPQSGATSNARYGCENLCCLTALVKLDLLTWGIVKQ